MKQANALIFEYLSQSEDAVFAVHIGAATAPAYVTYLNDACCVALGCARDEVIDQPLGQFLDADLAAWIAQAAAREGSQKRANACILRHPATRKKIFADVSVTALPDPDGPQQIAIATLRSISDQHPSGRGGDARLAAIFDSYDKPVVVYDDSLRIISWNVAYATLNKYDPTANLEGMHLRELLTHAARNGRYPEAAGQLKAWVDDILSSARDSQASEDIPLDDNRHFRLSRSRTSDGDFVAIFTDITESVQQKNAAEQAQERLIAALNAYPAPFAIYDANHKLVVWNSAYREAVTSKPDGLFVGIDAEAVIDQAFAENKIPNGEGQKRVWVELLKDKAAPFVEVEDIELEGDRHQRLHRTRADNGDTMLLRIDTTELVRQRRKLEVIQKRMFSAINVYPDPFAIYDKDHRILLWNPAYPPSMGCQPDMVRVGTHLRTLLRILAYSGTMRAAIGREEEWLNETYQPEVLDPAIVDFEFSDTVTYRIVRSRTADGDFVVIRINISEVVKKRREVEEYANRLEGANGEITFMALHDDLTGLGNRRYLTRKLDEFVQRRNAKGGEIAALHVDLDRFKQINDTMGHAAGDHVLNHAARIIKGKVDAKDVVARIGGDEFVVLMTVGHSCDRPETLAKRIIDDLARPIRIEGREFRTGASIGIARTPLTQEQDLLTNSDIALYNAKNAGRAQFRTFDSRDLEALRYNKVLSDEILQGVERWEFIPYFQPQVDPLTGEVVCIEALARWIHPQRGLLTPDQFLPMASELNVVSEIDRQIFEQSLELCQWHFGGYQRPPTIAFNVSGQRVMTADLSEIETLSNAYAGAVAFELLETVFLEEADVAFMEKLQKFRDLEIAIEIDDFGSGRASVVALQRIGPDRIKIDRRLVASMLDSEGALQLVQSIIDMGLAMNIGITAEGVETAAHVNMLAHMGCDRLQGYFYSEPTGQLKALLGDQLMKGRSA